jgi:hypothetical protein
MNKNPVEVLAKALHHAANIALPNVSQDQLDREAMASWSAEQRYQAAKSNALPYKPGLRRPMPEECEVKAMFLQTWSSTALGFGGIGGAAITTAYTAVIQGPDRTIAVYWAGLLAYLIPAEVQGLQREMFDIDVSKGHTVSRRGAGERYGALLPLQD